VRQQGCDEACCCWQCRGTAVAAGVLCVVHGSCVSKHDWSRHVMRQAHYCSVCASRELSGQNQHVSTKNVCHAGQCNVPYAMQLVGVGRAVFCTCVAAVRAFYPGYGVKG